LLRRLGIPEIVHCMSSLDRTSTAGSAISAGVYQYRDLCEKKNGKDSVPDLDEVIETDEFKELAFSNLTACEINGRLSRGDDGLKIGTGATPDVLKILPNDLLVDTTPILKQMIYVAAFLALLGAVALLALNPFALGIIVGIVLLGYLISELARITGAATWHGTIGAFAAKILFLLGALCSLPAAPFRAAYNAGKIVPEKTLNNKKLLAKGIMAGPGAGN